MHKSGSGCCRACLVRLGVVVQHATGSEERPAAAAAAGEGGAMRIAVYGAGGVGGYFGGRLAQAGADVHLIARGAHLQVLRTHGLRVRSVKGDFAVRLPATADPAAVRLGPLLGEDTAVVSLQNGVDNEEKLARVVGPAHVMGGAAFIFAGISEPGVIVHTGGPTTSPSGSWTAGAPSGHNGCSPATSRPASPPNCHRPSRRCCGPSSPSFARRPA